MDKQGYLPLVFPAREHKNHRYWILLGDVSMLLVIHAQESSITKGGNPLQQPCLSTLGYHTTIPNPSIPFIPTNASNTLTYMQINQFYVASRYQDSTLMLVL